MTEIRMLRFAYETQNIPEKKPESLREVCEAKSRIGTKCRDEGVRAQRGIERYADRRSGSAASNENVKFTKCQS